MVAYDVSKWGDLFVAVSINPERILALPGLPERALQTVLMLAIVVVISIVGLIPGQDRVALGVELLVVAVGYAAALVLTSRRNMPTGDQPRVAASTGSPPGYSARSRAAWRTPGCCWSRSSGERLVGASDGLHSLLSRSARRRIHSTGPALPCVLTPPAAPKDQDWLGAADMTMTTIACGSA